MTDLPKLQAVCEQHKIKLEVVKGPEASPKASPPQEARKTAPVATGGASGASAIPSKAAQGRTQAPPDMRANIPAPPDLAAPSPSPKRDGGAQVASVKGGGDMGTRPSEDPALLATGVIFSAKEGETKDKKIPILTVNWKGTYFTTFNKVLWPFLKAGQGMDAELLISDNKFNIIGIKRIKNRLFDADGKTPIVELNEFRSSNVADLFK